MRFRRSHALTFLLRVVVAILLATVLSGVPTAGLYVLGGEEPVCDGDCPSSDDTGHCPPNCTHGDCAKMHPAPLPNAIIPPLVTPARELIPVPTPVPRFRARFVPDGVFHPPRA